MAQNNPVGTHIVTDGAVGTRVFVGNTTPSYPTTGDLWIDNTAGSAPNQTFFSYTATGGETSVSVTYTVGTESVFLNGTKLLRGTDYVATSGTAITGLTALSAGDIVEVVWFTSFLVNGSLPLSTVTTAGDLIVGTGASTVSRLGIGTNGQLLQSNGTTATWATISTSPWTSSAISGATTAATRYQYFCDTTSAAFTLTLPSSPNQGDEIRVFDAKGSAATNNITVAPAGTTGYNYIQGSNQNFVVNVNYGSATLVFTGTTYGWKVA